MERESIDFTNKTLARYNKEMLSIAGILCRIIYEDEMSRITKDYNEIIKPSIKSDDEDTKCVRERLEKLERQAARVLDHFTFKPSMQNLSIGREIESRFFNCKWRERDLTILSTKGVTEISKVRFPDPEMKGFIKNVPVVPNIILEQCNVFFKKSTNPIKKMTNQDVLYELKNRNLCENEMIEFLKWWNKYNFRLATSEKAQLMQFATIHTCDESRPLTLNSFVYFLNPGIIPPDVDLPPEVLPYNISKNLQHQDLKRCFGWSELPLVSWARFIADHPDLEVSSKFAEKVFQILERNFQNTSQPNKETICQLFSQKKCIPTKFGMKFEMKFPHETYFHYVNLFSDLPIIQFQKPSSVQNVMELLGVRKVVELQIIFDRLVEQRDCDHMQLAKYLALELKNLKEDEIMKLKTTPIWPKENSVDPESSTRRFIISDLYTPTPINREFGMPILYWKRWSRYTLEGRFVVVGSVMYSIFSTCLTFIYIYIYFFVGKFLIYLSLHD